MKLEFVHPDKDGSSQELEFEAQQDGVEVRVLSDEGIWSCITLNRDELVKLRDELTAHLGEPTPVQYTQPRRSPR